MIQGDEAEGGGEREGEGGLTSSDESAKRKHFGTLIDRVYLIVPIHKNCNCS